jgi:hypothetical protein
MTRAREWFWYLVWFVVRAYAFTRPRHTFMLDGSPYVTRWYLTGSRREIRAALERGETGMPGTWLHYFHRADADRRLHNHPYAWCRTRILRGGYTELRAYGDRDPWVYEHRAGVTSVIITHGTWHRIASLHGETWTLFTAGPKHGRGWGFRPAQHAETALTNRGHWT